MMEEDEQAAGFVELGAERPLEHTHEDEGASDAAQLMRPRSGAQIFDLSMEVIMGRFLACVGVCALLWFPLRVVMPWFVDMTDASAMGGGGDAEVFIFLGFTFGLVLVQLLVGILSMTAVTVIVYGELVGRPAGAMDALMITLRRTLPLIGIFFLTGLVVGVGAT